MAQLQENILSIITTFYTYAQRDGDCGTLSKEELRQLIQQEFADVIVNPQSLETTEKVLCSLDDDCNNRVDFSEFLALVFHMAKACYKQLRQGQARGKGQVQEEACREDAAHGVSHYWQIQDNQVQGAETPETPQAQEAPDEEPEALQAERTKVPEQDPKRSEILGLETAKQNKYTHPAEENEAPKQDPNIQETKRPEEGPNNHQDVDTQENALSNLQAPEMESAEHGLNCPPDTPARDASSEMQMCKAPQQDPNPSETCKLQLPEQDESPKKGAKTQETHQDPPLHQSHEPEVQELSDGDAQF